MKKKTVEEIKKEQGWEKTPPCCKKCKYFTSKTTTVTYAYGSYTKEVGLKCTLGSFKTGKTNWCPRCERKKQEDKK